MLHKTLCKLLGGALRVKLRHNKNIYTFLPIFYEMYIFFALIKEDQSKTPRMALLPSKEGSIALGRTKLNYIVKTKGFLLFLIYLFRRLMYFGYRVLVKIFLILKKYKSSFFSWRKTP